MDMTIAATLYIFPYQTYLRIEAFEVTDTFNFGKHSLGLPGKNGTFSTKQWLGHDNLTDAELQI